MSALNFNIILQENNNFKFSQKNIGRNPTAGNIV